MMTTTDWILGGKGREVVISRDGEFVSVGMRWETNGVRHGVTKLASDVHSAWVMAVAAWENGRPVDAEFLRLNGWFSAGCGFHPAFCKHPELPKWMVSDCGFWRKVGAGGPIHRTETRSGLLRMFQLLKEAEGLK